MLAREERTPPFLFGVHSSQRSRGPRAKPAGVAFPGQPQQLAEAAGAVRCGFMCRGALFPLLDAHILG